MDLLIQDIHKCEIFVGLFQYVKFMTEHINIIFEPERFYMQCMDNSHVAIMEISLPSTWFDGYIHNNQGGNIMLGMNVNIFYRILSSREKGQTINMVYRAETNDTVTFNLASETKTEFDKHFEMPLIDVDAEIMEIPKMDYQAELKLVPSQFFGVLHQLKMFGDTMDISCSESRIMLASHSVNQGKMFVEIAIEDLTEFSIEENKTLEMSFSLGYLHNIMQYHKLAREVHLGFSESSPMSLRFPLTTTAAATIEEEEGGGGDEPWLSFHLAPKIDDDE